jgi:hypothetical protein
MPILDYVSRTPDGVSVTYADMPAGAAVAFVNQTSGKTTPANSGALSAGGSGSADIPLGGLAPGKYYLLAQEGDQALAQTVPFYVN